MHKTRDTQHLLKFKQRQVDSYQHIQNCTYKLLNHFFHFIQLIFNIHFLLLYINIYNRKNNNKQ